MSHSTVVLVVEDQPMLRLAAVEMVELAGFIVVEAASAAQALRILETRSDVRILLSDIDMPPGLNGVELAVLTRDRWPPIEIILVSAYAVPPSATLPAGTKYFVKPYREGDVVEEIKKMVA